MVDTRNFSEFWGKKKQKKKMMLSASPSMIVRSSLEEMLDSLRRKDEEDKPKDLPPALPSRPTSRGRLPPARRSLPTNFKVDSDGGTQECSPSVKEEAKRKEKDLGVKRNSFGSKKTKREQNVESPYVLPPEETKIELIGGLDQAPTVAASSALPSRAQDLDCDDNIAYFINKVIVFRRLMAIC